MKGLIIPIIHVMSASSTRAARRDEDHVGISKVLFSAKKKKEKKEEKINFILIKGCGSKPKTAEMHLG